jgi:hypothetical protein
MKEDIDETNWLEGYQMLQHVNAANAFVVPHNYFEGAEEQISKLIELHSKIAGDTGLKVADDYFDTNRQQIEAQVNVIALSDDTGVNAFKVPADYFDALTQKIQSRISMEEVLQTKGFVVPDAYFEELEKNIESRIVLETAGINERFELPNEYFNSLSADIQTRIFIDDAVNGPSFGIPEGYFSELELNIQSRISIDELVNETEGFSVPQSYFTSLENTILEKTTGASNEAKLKEAKRGVIRKLWATTSFKYASAACFSLIIGSAIFITQLNNPVAVHKRSYLHKELSKVPSGDLESYLQLNGDTPHAIMENVDPNILSIQAAEDNANQSEN